MNVIYLLLGTLGVLVVVLLLVRIKRRKGPQPVVPRTYGGAIRFTDPSGRNMKIIQKDDGTFETIEE
jgi:hypothetical protein